jgi:hypothetical protein
MSPSLEAYVRTSLKPPRADMCHHVMSTSLKCHNQFLIKSALQSQFLSSLLTSVAALFIRVIWVHEVCSLSLRYSLLSLPVSRSHSQKGRGWKKWEEWVKTMTLNFCCTFLIICASFAQSFTYFVQGIVIEYCLARSSERWGISSVTL